MSNQQESSAGGGGGASPQETRIDPVNYYFNVTGGPNPLWGVRRFHFTEGLSQTFELTLDLWTDELSTDTDLLLGADAQLDIERGELLREVCGVIHRVDFIGISHDQLLVRLYIVPAFRLLTQRVDYRVFQDMTVPEILEEVLNLGMEDYKRTVDISGLSETYPRRDYCVQYGESDHDFCSRLMEENGIAYLFVPGGGKEILTLVDQDPAKANASFPELEALLVEPIVPIIPQNPEEADRESLRFFDWCQPQMINAVHSRTFNFKVPDPAKPPEAMEQVPDAKGRVREMYIFSDRRKITDSGGNSSPTSTYTGAAEDESTPRALRRRQLFARNEKRGQGRSNVSGFAAGYRFMLGDHTLADVERTNYLLTRVIHTGEGTSGTHTAGYENSFECIPEDVPFRPAVVTPKPRTYGPQTATVTGASGDEIHVDLHGRIKVRFHWDRKSPLDNTSSCWVRVAQMWAGSGWGTVFIPRVGMEVVVDFLGGNPDCPLVIGCVYNGTNKPPYALPDEKTKTTIKTESSPGGGGNNEITFEDAKGNELIYIHAQKDKSTVVENDQSLLVKVNRVKVVGGNQTEDVTGDKSIHVAGNHAEAVDKDYETLIQGNEKRTVLKTQELKVNQSRTEFVGAEDSLTVVKGKKVTVGLTSDETVGAKKTVQVGGLYNEQVGASRSITAVGAFTVTAGLSAKMNSAKDIGLSAESKVSIEAGAAAELTTEDKLTVTAKKDVSIKGDKKGVFEFKDELAIKVGKAKIVMKKNGDITINGKKITVKGSGDVVLKGSKVTAN